MLEAGFLVALGILVMLARLPWRHKLWMTSNPLACDVICFIALTGIHWGTFSGVMAATVGALFCSVMLSLARRIIGYVERGRYVRGFLDVSNRVR